MGRAFAQGALEAGHRVIGTVRRKDDADTYAAFAPDRAHPLVLDVTDYAAIPVAVADASWSDQSRDLKPGQRLHPSDLAPPDATGVSPTRLKPSPSGLL